MTDEKILALYWERSEEAIAQTQKQYGKLCRAIARGILGNAQDAEEVFNDACLKAWDQIPPQKPDPLKNFLARITRQLSINRLEKNTAQKRGGSEYTLALEELSQVAANGTDFTEQLALRDSLERFLRDLPQDQRGLFVRRYWYFDSLAQIAKGFGLSQSAVKMRLLRLRQALAQHLEKEGFL